VISCPNDIIIICGESTDPDYAGYATAEDNCDPDPTVSYSDIQEDNVITRIWTAMDDEGNVSDPCVQSITVAEAMITSVNPHSAAPGESVTLHIIGENTCFGSGEETHVRLIRDLRIIEGTAIVVTSQTYIEATLAIPTDAPTGLYSVEVEDVGVITVAKENDFMVGEGWAMTIHAEGEYDIYATHAADVTVGVSEQEIVDDAPPNPVDYTVLMTLYRPDNTGPFARDIREDGADGYRWIICINPHGTVPPLAERCATISWNPADLDSDSHYRLIDMGLDGNGDDIVIADMRTTTEYEICGLDQSHYFAMVSWSADYCFDVELTAGWQLVSLPLIPDNNDVTTLFSGYLAAWGYDNVSRQYEQETEFYPCEGYWLKMESDMTVTICGQPLADCINTLDAGWHLVGGTNCLLTPRTDPPECLAAEWGYNTDTETYEQPTEFEPSVGYWVMLNDECDLTLECGSKASRQSSVHLFTQTTDAISRRITLHAVGADLDGARECDVVIGIDSTAHTYWAAPPQPAYSVSMTLYRPDWSGPYYEDIRQTGFDTDHWIIAINPHGNINPPDERSATISWDPSEFGDDFYTLREGFDGTGRVVLEDMSAVTEYEVTGTNGQYYFTLTRISGQAMGMADEGTIVPLTYRLDHCYPNPFNPTTQIEFGIPTASQVKLEIHNITGQMVATMVDGHFEAGNYVIQWNGKDLNGRPVASGIYFYRLQVIYLR